jgi:ribosomal protein L11 methyltransferase
VQPVTGGLAAILPDTVTPDAIADTLRVAHVAVSTAVGRDNGSVWLLSPHSLRIGSIVIAAANDPRSDDGALRLIDSTVFGSGHHPTTALCLEAIEEAHTHTSPDSILDVGTGSGILALAALKMGIPRATGLDTDAEALKAAAENARLNNLSDRLRLVPGGPEAVRDARPLVVANILAAPLMEMARDLVRCVGHSGSLILSGIPTSLELQVAKTYQRAGMRHVRSDIRRGWVALVLQASW